MAAQALTPAAEDYLKAVFALCSHGAHAATTSELAQRLGVSSPSVSAMVGRLEDEGLVRRAEGRGVELTPAGERAALRVVRRHRLLETFLARVLDVPWDEVHAEAERLEHAVSDGLEARIDRLLGFPTHDPHGDPIPPLEGGHREETHTPLVAAPAGARFLVDRVSDRDPAALRHLGHLGITPGTPLLVGEQEPFGGPLWVTVGDQRHALGAALTHIVFGVVED